MKKIFVLSMLMLMVVVSSSTASANEWVFKKRNSNIDFSQLHLQDVGSYGEYDSIQLKDGRVMVFGTKNSYIYNYLTKTWKKAAPVIQKGGELGAPLLLKDGRVMAFTTKSEEGVARAEIYNPATNKWSLTGNLNTVRITDFGSVLMRDGKVMIAGGGQYTGFKDGGNVEVYDPNTNRWSKGAPTVKGDDSSVKFLTLHDNKILALTGAVYLGDGSIFNTQDFQVLELYDPSTKRWKEFRYNSEFNSTRKMMYLSNGSILVLSALNAGIYYFEKDEYKPIINSFEPYDAVEMQDGRVLITGEDNGGSTGEAYIYTIDTGQVNKIQLPVRRPLLYQFPNGDILTLGKMKKTGEYSLTWDWNAMYESFQPGLFLDVPSGYWAVKEIKFLTELQIIKGHEDGRYGALEPVTREQGAVMLARALDLNLNDRPDPGFKDLKPDYWAYKEIAALVDEGIYPKGETFHKGAAISRELMAQLLVNGYHLEGQSGQVFTDVPEKSPYYSFIDQLAANKITTGYPDNTFKPKDSVNRTQFAVFMARVMDSRFIK